MDVDLVDYKLTTVKIETNDTKIFNDIDELEKYLSSDKFDFINIIEDPEFEDPIQTEPDPVALRVRYDYEACVNGVQGVYQATYFLGRGWNKSRTIY